MAQKKTTKKVVQTKEAELAAEEISPKKPKATKKKLGVGDNVTLEGRVISIAKGGKDVCVQVLQVSGKAAEAYKTLWLSLK